jgi:hypothetical protein
MANIGWKIRLTHRISGMEHQNFDANSTLVGFLIDMVSYLEGIADSKRMLSPIHMLLSYHEP